MDKITRRSFIKKTAVAAAGISAFPMIFIPKAKAQWAKKTVVHPNVDNLRVVGITDTRMTKNAEHIPQGWAGQEKLVNTKVVWENIDKMACGLCDTSPQIMAGHGGSDKDQLHQSTAHTKRSYGKDMSSFDGYRGRGSLQHPYL